jgi:hypothetical protein
VQKRIEWATNTFFFERVQFWFQTESCSFELLAWSLAPQQINLHL